MVSPLDLSFLIGACFVAVNAYDRFNTPASNRATTTALRYYLGATAYVAIAFFTFFTLSRYPDLLKLIAGSHLDAQVGKLPPALMTALVLTVLLEKMPFFASLDKWMRERLQNLARIPHEARRLSRRLQRCPVRVPAEREAQLIDKLAADGVQSKDVRLLESDSLQHLWTKTSFFMEQLESWEGEARLSGFMHAFEADHRQLKHQYRQLAQKAASTFRMADELASPQHEARSAQLMNAHLRDFKDDAMSLYAGLCDFISRAALQCCLSEKARLEQLKSFGFADVQTCSRSQLSFNQLSSMFVLVSCILMFGMVVASQAGETAEQQIVKVFMIATIYIAAIACAIYPKDRWKFAQRPQGGHRPTAFYLIAGVMAAAIGLLISAGFKLILYHFDAQQTLHDMSSAYPWSFLTFATAALTAFQTDNRQTRLGKLQPLAEGVFQCLATLACAFVTYQWLLSAGSPVAKSGAFLARVLPLTAAIGFCIGMLVPAWYRRAVHDVKDSPEA